MVETGPRRDPPPGPERATSGRRARLQAALAALGVGLALAALGWPVARWHAGLLRNEARQSVERETAILARTLSRDVEQRVAVLVALETLSGLRQPTVDLGVELGALVRNMRDRLPGVRRLILLPAGATPVTYELTGPIGRASAPDPGLLTREDAGRAAATGQTVLSAPRVLPGGQLQLVALRAVLRDGRPWGFVAVELDLAAILSEEGVATPAPSRLLTGLRDASGGLFAGSPAAFDHDPVVTWVSLPGSGWHLGAVPTAGWDEPHRQRRRAGLVLGALAIALGMLATYQAVGARARLALAVGERTRDLERARDEATRRRQEAEGLARAAAAVASGQDVSAVAQRIVDNALPLLGVRATTLRRAEPDGSLVVIATTGGKGAFFPLGSRLPAGIGLTGLAVAEGRALWTSDQLADPRLHYDATDRQAILTSGNRSVLSAPLITGGRLIGALTAVDTRVRTFTEAQVALLQAFADHAALALERAELSERLQSRADRLQTLTDVNQLVSSSLDPDRMLPEIARAGAVLVGDAVTAFWMVAPDGTELELRAVSDQWIFDEYPVRRMPLGAAVTGRAAAQRQAVESVDVQADPTVMTKAWLRRHQIQSLLALPVVDEGTVLAVLVVLRRVPGSVPADVRRVLDSLAAHAAAALRNARLFAAERSARTSAEAAAAALGQSEARYRSFLEGSVQGIYVHADGVIRYANSACARMLGFPSAEAMIGEPYWAHVAEAERPRLERYRQARLSGGESPVEYEYRASRGDGTRVWLQNVSSRIVWEGQPAVLATLLDVTERKRSHERFRLAVDAAPSGMLMVNRQGRIVLVNAEAERLFGYPRAELLGQPVEMLVPAEARDAHPGERATFLQAPRARAMGAGQDVHGLRKDGTLVPVEIGLTPVDTPDGLMVLAAVVDISERRAAEAARARLEEQLRHSQKLEAVGQLAGGVAHDVNNALAVILGFAELALAERAPDDPIRDDLQEILRAGLRARDVVRQILTFSRREPPARQPVVLADVLSEAVRLLRASLPSTIDIRPRLQAPGATVLADPTQMHQVLLNLATNAEHAMRGQAGILSVALDEVRLEPGVLHLAPDANPGSYLRLRVGDTGLGMASDVRERIFEPFFTTKPVGEGTGLGLAVVHGIVAAHGGFIRVETSPGQGTTFDIFLPRADAPARAPLSSVAALADRRARVLLVDDEPALVRVGVQMLTSLGYQAVGCEDPREALALIQGDPAGFELVISDQTMPDLPGIQLAGELARLRPGLPVVLCTGYDSMVTAQAAAASGVRDVLQKPLSLHELSESVRRILG